MPKPMPTIKSTSVSSNDRDRINHIDMYKKNIVKNKEYKYCTIVCGIDSCRIAFNGTNSSNKCPNMIELFYKGKW